MAVMASVPAASPVAVASSSKIPLYTHSSQYNHYTFSSLASPSSSTSSPAAPPLTPPLPLPQKNLDVLKAYYLSRLPLLCKAFKLDERVLSTAMSYFKRFWQDGNGERNVAEPFDRSGKGRDLRGGRGVKVVMLICLYLSLKTHSIALALPEFARKLHPSAPVSANPTAADIEAVRNARRETEEHVRDNEFEVAEVLRWRFRVRHAFEGVRGMAIALQTIDPPLSPTLLTSVQPLLDNLSSFLRLSSAEFLYTPSQIALATWWALTLASQSSSTTTTAAAAAAAAADSGEESITVAEADRLSIEERASLRTSLESLLQSTTPPSSSSSTTASTSSSSSFPEELLPILSIHLAEGRRLDAHLKSAEGKEQVKMVDGKLKEWEEERRRVVVSQGGIEVEREETSTG